MKGLIRDQASKPDAAQSKARPEGNVRFPFRPVFRSNKASTFRKRQAIRVISNN